MVRCDVEPLQWGFELLTMMRCNVETMQWGLELLTLMRCDVETMLWGLELLTSVRCDVETTQWGLERRRNDLFSAQRTTKKNKRVNLNSNLTKISKLRKINNFNRQTDCFVKFKSLRAQKDGHQLKNCKKFDNVSTSVALISTSVSCYLLLSR